MCGGTQAGVHIVEREAGLSPRVRGNLQPHGGLARPGRSIPACAGEPRRSDGLVVLDEVYPRVCGGTLGALLREMAL